MDDMLGFASEPVYGSDGLSLSPRAETHAVGVPWRHLDCQANERNH